MKLDFSEIKDPDFQALVAKARSLTIWGILNKYKLKDIRDYAYSIKDPMSENELKFIYSLENPQNVKNVLCSEAFNPLNFTMEIPTTFLCETKSGAKITLDLRRLNDGGGLGKFICDHTARIIHSFKQSSLIPSLKLTGFIHVPEFPDFLQFSEVLGLAIKGIYEQFSNDKTVRIMLTGFTRFKRVKDNPTGRFLFGDGITNEIDSFAFMEPASEAVINLDQMIQNQFGKEISGDYLIENGLKVGRFYTFPGNKRLELILVRLPVDTTIKRQRTYDPLVVKTYHEFLNDLADNLFGDRVQHILNYTANLTKPLAIISLGAHCLLPSDIYEIETEIYGLDGKYSKGVRPVYPSHAGKGTNMDLADIYRTISRHF